MKVTDSQYGFTWGPLTVERACSDEKGWVYLLLKTKRDTLEVYVTPTGFMRVGSEKRRKAKQ